jgi:hypothetical protein
LLEPSVFFIVISAVYSARLSDSTVAPRMSAPTIWCAHHWWPTSCALM